MDARRDVFCDCGYMATEIASTPDAKCANGCCTKCGRVWSSELTDAEQAALPPDPTEATP
jgi:hypothetical protein